MRKKIGLFLVLTMALLTLVGCGNKKEETLTVSIAASLQKPMEEIAENFERESGIKVQYNVGGSGTLKKQIVDGADVDLFLSANTKYVNELEEDGLADKENTVNLLTNSLVLIEGNSVDSKIKSLDDLKKVSGKIAMGEVSTVPAGQYAKQTLDKLGLYNSIKDKLVFARSVTNVKTYVENGEADFGFVYKTDAMDLKNSKIAYEIPNGDHKSIEYELCLLKSSKNIENSKKFIEFLKGEESKKIFVEYDFGVN